MILTGPESCLGITKSGAINEWTMNQHQLNWNHVLEQMLSKRMMKRPLKRLSADLH